MVCRRADRLIRVVELGCCIARRHGRGNHSLARVMLALQAALASSP
jgi:hypothetical protein